MKKFFYKAGVVQLFILLFLHLYNNRNGLPIPNVDQESNELLHLMKTYEIEFFSIGAKHTLDEAIWGYDLTWASFVIFAFLISMTALKFKFFSPKVGRYMALCNTILWGLATTSALIFWNLPEQITFGLLFLTFLLSCIFEWRTPKPKDTRVCIVGAGISGLTAGYQLKKQGYNNVTVIEKADRVGGKCYSPVVDNHPYDLGGHEMLAGYTDVMNIAEELNAPNKESIPPLVYNKNQKKYLNFKESANADNSYSIMQVMWASTRYLFMVLFKYRKYSQPSTGFGNMPQELAMPLDDWLEKNKLKPLNGILDFVVKVQDYGKFKSSAGYLVKFMGARNWFSLLTSGMGITHKWPRVFVFGMQNLCERMAATILDTRISTNISKIERDKSKTTGGVLVYFEGKQEPEIFDKLIISTPLDIPKVKYLDLTSVEKNLFSQIKNSRCFSTMCKVQGLPAGVVASIPFNDMEKGDYTGYIKDYPETDYNYFFSVADDPNISPENVKEDIVKILTTIPDYKGVKPKVNEFFLQKEWQYFPHVSPQAFHDGYYNKLEAIQGENHSYFASSFLSFECVGNSVAYAKRLVEKNF